jgi:RNA polymerase sigma-70 factor (ECF subfamily)
MPIYGMGDPVARTTSTSKERSTSARFGALLQQHRGIVLKVASTYCRNSADRDDLVQEITAQLWRSFPSFDPGKTFSTWMYRVALNVAISFARGRTVREQHTVALDESLHDAVDENAADPETDEHIALLYAFIDRLDALNRALLLLYLDERSHRDIADVLGITETNVATKIGRLKRRLREETYDGTR